MLSHQCVFFYHAQVCYVFSVAVEFISTFTNIHNIYCLLTICAQWAVKVTKITVLKTDLLVLFVNLFLFVKNKYTSIGYSNYKQMSPSVERLAAWRCI